MPNRTAALDTSRTSSCGSMVVGPCPSGCIGYRQTVSRADFTRLAGLVHCTSIPTGIAEAAIMPATLEKLTTSAAARVAGVSEQSIRQWVRRGLLPAEIMPLGLLVS